MHFIKWTDFGEVVVVKYIFLVAVRTWRSATLTAP